MTTGARPLGSALLAWVPTRRWFGGKGRSLERLDLVDHADLPGQQPVRLQLIEARYADGEAERYFVPLTGVADDAADSLGTVALEARSVALGDALENPAACRTLLDALSRAARVPSARGGAIDFQPGPVLAELAPAARAAEARPLGAEQSNSTVVFGDALLLKCFRRVYDGPNPDLEVPRFLATRTGFDRLPGLAGAIEYLAPHGPSASLALGQEFVPNDGDGWSYTLAELAAGQPAGRALVDGPAAGGAYAAAIAALGQVTAQLHQALASDPSAPDFAPLPVGPAELAAWRQTIHSRLEAGLARLRQVEPSLAEADRRAASRVLAASQALEALIGGLADWPESGTGRIRYHGDYHLGQVLHSVRGWLVLDFEGEPLRPLAERRARHCPLRDVAGLLRSLNYAAETARRARPAEASWLAAWEAAARQRFLVAYLEPTAGAASFLPADPALVRAALGAFELEKAVYELEYELGNRPDWVGIPLAFLAAQSARSRPPGARWRRR